MYIPKFLNGIGSFFKTRPMTQILPPASEHQNETVKHDRATINLCRRFARLLLDDRGIDLTTMSDDELVDHFLHASDRMAHVIQTFGIGVEEASSAFRSASRVYRGVRTRESRSPWPRIL